jgi:hypothetical protein
VKGVGSKLQDFKIWGFMVSNAKKQHTTTPEFRKVKGCGINTSGFQDSGFQGFKYQTTTHNNFQIMKGERVWDHHFGISGFGVSGFGKAREHHINVTSKYRMLKITLFS